MALAESNTPLVQPLCPSHCSGWGAREPKRRQSDLKRERAGAVLEIPGLRAQRYYHRGILQVKKWELNSTRWELGSLR